MTEKWASSLATAPDDRALMDYAPPMPTDFWGVVSFTYQNGRFVAAEVKQTFKPRTDR